MNSNVIALRGRVSSADRQAIGARMEALEQACHKLLDLIHPHDSPFLRRDGLSHQEAEVVHRLVSRLMSQISQAAWDLGLDRTIQNAGQEAASLVSNMKQMAQELASLKISTAHMDLGLFLQAFADESLRILNDMSHMGGKTRPEAHVSRERGTNHD